MECRITGIYFIMSMKLWTILMINCPPSCNPINLSYRVYSRLDWLLRCTEFFYLVVVGVQCTFVSGTEHTFLSGSIIIVHRAHTYFLVLLQPLHRPSLFLASVQCVHLLLVLLQCTESTVISGIITVYRVHTYSIIHSVLLQYIILCLEYTVSSGIIIIEFIDCISIWDISTRYIVYFYFEYYFSVQLAVHP